MKSNTITIQINTKQYKSNTKAIRIGKSYLKNAHAPRVLELEGNVKGEEDEVRHGQGGQVGPGRGSHAGLDPDGEGKDVARESDQPPDGDDYLVDEQARRAVDGGQSLHRGDGNEGGRLRGVAAVEIKRFVIERVGKIK